MRDAVSRFLPAEMLSKGVSCASQANQHFNYLMKAYAAVNPNVHYLVRPCIPFRWKAHGTSSDILNCRSQGPLDVACLFLSVTLAPLLE